eukprot:473733_1
MSEIELNTESKIDLIAVDLDIHDQRIDGLEHSVQCIRQLHNINNNSNHNKPNNNKKRRKRKKDKKRRKQRRRRQRAAYEQAHQAKFVDVDSNPKWMFITKYFGEKCRDSSMSLRCDYLVQLNANSKLLRAARNGMSEMFNDCDNGDEMNTNNQANINHPSANVEMNQNNVEMDRNDDNDDDDLDFLETNPFALRYA